MNGASTGGFNAIVVTYFPIVVAIVGTIAVALGGLSKFKEKRQADLVEATTTWRGLAESRQAALEEERTRGKKLAEALTEAKLREETLWGTIRQLQSRLPHSALDIAPLPPPPQPIPPSLLGESEAE